MQAVDTIRKAWVQPMMDGLRWRTGAQFFDVSVWLLTAGRAFLLGYFVLAAYARVATGKAPVVDVQECVVYGGEIAILSVALLPDARRFAAAARRDPFLVRDARYHAEPSRLALGLLLAFASALCLIETAMPASVLLSGPAGHAGAWLAAIAVLSASPLGFLLVALGLLAGGCERSRHGTGRSSSGRRGAAASPVGAK